MKTLKTLILFSFLFVCGMNVSADNKSNLIYNSEEVNGMKVAETVYKMDGSTLANYMKYNYKYDDSKRMVESEALRWDSDKDEWQSATLIKESRLPLPIISGTIKKAHTSSFLK